MAGGKWVIVTHTGKGVAEKRLKWVPGPRKCKRKPPRAKEEKLLRRLEEIDSEYARELRFRAVLSEKINENFLLEAGEDKITYDHEEE